MKGTARIDMGLQTGSKAFAKFSMDKVVVFDAASGNRIWI